MPPVLAHLAELQDKAAGRDAHGILELALTGEFAGKTAVVSSFGAESAVLLQLVAADRSQHADPVPQHRQAVRRDAALSRPAAGRAGPGRCALAGAHRWRTAPPTIPKARCGRKRRRCLLRFPQDRAAGPRAGAVRGPDHRPQALPDPRARRHAGGGIFRRPLPLQSAVATGTWPTWKPISSATSCRAIRWWRTAIPRIGCMPCTRRVQAGEDYRAGRWAGLDKDECGIHLTDGGGI